MATSANVKISRGHGVLRTADGERQWPVSYTASATSTRVLQGSVWVGELPDLRAVVTVAPDVAAELSASAAPLELQLENGQWVPCVMADAAGTLVPRGPGPIG